ncbi:MAG: hypothetical protein WBF53_12775 [Litorimonas sp.]
MTVQPTPYHKDYEITDAMFGAFRSPGGMPFFWKLLGWGTLLFFVFNFLTVPFMISTYTDFLVAAVEVENSPEDAMALMGSMGRFLGLVLLWSVAYFAVTALIRAAFYRGYFFGETQATFPFRLGRDELQQFLAGLGYWALFYLFMFLSTLALIVVVVVMTLLAALLPGEPGTALAMIGILMLVLLYGLMVAVWIWFGVKFVCAGALTALRGTTHVMAARHVSKNRFWALFGSLLVAAIIGYAATNVAFYAAIGIGVSGFGASDLFNLMTGTDLEASLEAIQAATQSTSFKLTTLLALLVASAGYAFYSILLAGPQAFFTRQWAEAGEG